MTQRSAPYGCLQVHVFNSVEVEQMTESVVKSFTEVVVNLNEKKPIRILHVDDDTDFLKIAKQCLETEGTFRIDTATSVDEALQKMKTETYDAIVSDYQMPGKDGLEFLKELREKGNQIPFIIFTGKGREEVIIKALNLGANQYLNKLGDTETVYKELAHSITELAKVRKTEEELKSAYEKLQLFTTAAKASIDGFIMTDLQGRILEVNDSALRLYGTNVKSDLVGMNSVDLVASEEREKIAANMREVLAKGNSRIKEMNANTLKGARITVDYSITLVKDTEGNPIGFLGILRDVTERKKTEEQLRRSEEKLRNIFDVSANAIIVIDLNGNIVDINDRAQEIFGYPSKSDSIGRSALELIADRDRQRAIENMEKTLKQGLMRNIEYAIITPDGGERLLSVSASILKDVSGSPTGFVSVIEDITKRKKAEDTIIESEEKYKDLFENAMDAIITLDLKGNITAANNSVQRFGYKKEDLVGKNILNFISKEYLPTVMRDFSQVTKGEPAKNETEIVAPAGKILVEYHARTIVREGNVTGVQINLRDVTERKKAEEAVRSSEAKLRAILGSSPEAVSVCDLEANLIDCNDAFLRLHGYDSKEEVIGKSWAEIISLANRSKAKETMQKLLEHGEIKNVEFMLQKKNGQQFIGELSANIVPDSFGKPTSIVVVARDITERKEMEDKLKESEARFRDLFRNIQDPVGIFVGKEGRLLDYNAAFKKSSGYTDEELKGKVFLDFVYPDDHAMVLEKYRTKYSEEELPLIYEIRGLNKKGETIPLELSVSMYKQRGRVIGVEVIHRDITERKRYERSLSELNLHSRELNTAKSMEQIFERTLEAAEKTLGFEYADVFTVKGKTLQLVTHRGKTRITSLSLPLDGNKGITVKVANTGKPVLVPDVTKEEAYIEGAEDARSELAVPIKIGQRVLGVLNVESKRLNAFKEKDRELLEILASHAAIAMDNLKRAKELETRALEIQETRQKFEGLFFGNPEATVYLAPDFRIVDINPRFAELFGHSPSEIIGKSIDDVIVPENMIDEGKMLDEKAVDGYVYHDTVRKRKDGSLVPVSISAAPIRIGGHLAGYIGVYKDISKLKKTERDLEIMNEKLRVVGGLTRHDVRNRLSAITGNTYLLKKQLAGIDKALDKLGDMETAVQQAVKIFEFAKTYEMLGAEELAYIKVEETVKEAISLFLGLKDVKTINDCGGLSVLADSLLRQLFYNLIDNSLKHGQKITQIRIHYEKTPDNQLRLIYEDDGAGIPKNAREKLFTEGFTTGKGSGYGLYLIKKMMEVYGWTIQETGELGKGARFVMTIPKMNPNGKANYRTA